MTAAQASRQIFSDDEARGDRLAGNDASICSAARHDDVVQYVIDLMERIKFGAVY